MRIFEVYAYLSKIKDCKKISAGIFLYIEYPFLSMTMRYYR